METRHLLRRHSARSLLPARRSKSLLLTNIFPGFPSRTAQRPACIGSPKACAAHRGITSAIPEMFRSAVEKDQSCLHPTMHHAAPPESTCDAPNDAGLASRKSTYGNQEASLAYGLAPSNR